MLLMWVEFLCSVPARENDIIVGVLLSSFFAMISLRGSVCLPKLSHHIEGCSFWRASTALMLPSVPSEISLLLYLLSGAPSYLASSFPLTSGWYEIVTSRRCLLVCGTKMHVTLVIWLQQAVAAKSIGWRASSNVECRWLAIINRPFPFPMLRGSRPYFY